MQVRPEEHGLLLFAFQGKLYHYRVCHFGGRFSAFWWQRAGAFLLRQVHGLLAWKPRKAFLFMDDLLCALVRDSAPASCFRRSPIQPLARPRQRAVWPCLVKPAQRYIACFETLAQLALLQATHSHIGGGHYSLSMPSGTDNSATEASLNKLFTTSWPLQLFVQLTAFWAHAHNVLLQPTHAPGRCNDWADDLSRGRLARFSHHPESRMRFSPASLAMSGRGIQLCPMHAPWRGTFGSSVHRRKASLACIRRPSEPFSAVAFSARTTQPAACASRSDQKKVQSPHAELFTTQRAW